ncbi:hypothetical protein AKG98_25 [Moritella sp. JT01]|nr:hypothetical protein AKG98_25 [Moritella sp. JT01]
MLSGMIYTHNSLAVKGIIQKSGLIDDIYCSDSRLPEIKDINIVSGTDSTIEFSEEGNCQQLKTYYSQFKTFHAYQIKVPILDNFRNLSLVLDDVEKLNFRTERIMYNLYLLLSPLLAPLIIAIARTMNWRRQKTRDTWDELK